MNDPDPPSGDLPSRLGKGMLIGAWVTALALVWMLFQGVVNEQRNPNRELTVAPGQDGAARLVLQRNRAGHYVADGRINGTRVTFVVDTGATVVALPLDLARRLELPLRPGGRTMTANGSVYTWSTVLGSVDLGGLEVRDVRAVVLPNMPSREVLLGMNYLKRFEIVQRGEVLTLRLVDG
jgi:aspartyl protease family protein